MENRRPDNLNSVSPHILRLPVEVLQYIFEHATLYWFDNDPFVHSRPFDAIRQRTILCLFMVEGRHYQPHIL